MQVGNGSTYHALWITTKNTIAAVDNGRECRVVHFEDALA